MLRSADDEELELLVGTIIGSWGDVSDSNSSLTSTIPSPTENDELELISPIEPICLSIVILYYS